MAHDRTSAQEGPITPREFGDRYMRPQGFEKAGCGVLLAIGLVFLTFWIFVMPSKSFVQRRQVSCINGLKQMGVYFSMYESRFHRPLAIGTGVQSWFGQIWRPDMATDGHLFRCPVRGRAGTGTHYWCIVRGGTWNSASGPFSFTTGEDLANAPPDLPVACDALVTPPNHSDGSICVLYFDGSVREIDAELFAKSHPDFLGPSGWDAPAGTK